MAESVPPFSCDGGLRRPQDEVFYTDTLNGLRSGILSSLDFNSWRTQRLKTVSVKRGWTTTTSRLAIAVFCTIILLTNHIVRTEGIMKEIQPNLIVHSDELLSQSFPGNHSHVDYFRLLQRDGDSLLIGARNFVYNISMSDLSEHKDKRIEWVSKKTDSDMCFSKGKSESECHNYIRVLAKKTGRGEFLVCGTNAYKPTCRDYTIADDGSVSYTESPGVGRSPYDPRHNSTFVYVEGHLYAGTVVDFQGMIPLIFRDPLKTDHSDYKQLNVPDFVHSFEYGDFVFFFFRETAVEYMNCGKRIYSRVGRVCKSDRGIEQSRSSAMSTWTSFLKSRLNCSFPGDYPFYFDEIQSVSDVVLGSYGDSQNEIIYAIFTTPQNSIPGSAICSFSMREVLDAFEGPFIEQKDLNSNWVGVPHRMVPEPRPGSCVNNSQTLPQETINFVRSHPLMGDLVSPFLGRPILMKASFNYRFTKLTVDPQVYTITGEYVDVIFIATDVGMILKTINAPSAGSERQASPIVIEEIHAFDVSVSVNNLQIAKPTSGNEAKLIIITDNEVKAISLERCEKATSCSSCVALQDPYCAWSPNHGVCGPISKLGRDNSLLQNVSSGFHRLCPADGEINRLHGPAASRVYTTEAPPVPPVTKQAVETCTPCLCSEQPSSATSPSPVLNSSPISSQVMSEEGSTPSPSREILPFDVHLPNYAPHVPNVIVSNNIPGLQPPSVGEPPLLHRGRPYGSQGTPKRGAKELAMAGVLSSRQFNDVSSVAYSEGVTGPVVGASVRGPLIYSAETLAIAVTTACVAALVIGFISGFLFSRKCRGDDYPHLSETPYLDSKLNKCENTADPNMYTANNVSLPGPPPKQINNLVANYNPKNINAGKSITNTTSTDTKLIKQAKCAYI